MPGSSSIKRGNLKKIAQLDAEHGSVLAGFEVISKTAEAGDGKTDTMHKIKLCDKVRALAMAAKYFGLLTEKVDHSGEISFRYSQNSHTAVRHSAFHSQNALFSTK